MALDSVKIPQNVYVEDRIIGPITLRQIILCLLGGGLSYAIWSSMKAAGHVSILATALSWSPLLIMGAFAFVKINGITLFRLCLLIIERAEKPNTRVWTPRRGLEINIWTTQPTKKSSVATGDSEKHAERIQELSSVLDKGPDDEEEDIVTANSDYQPHLKAALHAAARPVDRTRVSVDSGARPPVDTVTSTAAPAPSAEPPLLRDIQPPSHG